MSDLAEAILLSRMHAWDQLFSFARSSFTQWGRQERALFGTALKNRAGHLRGQLRVLEKVLLNKRKSTHPYKDYAVSIIEEYIVQVKRDIEQLAQEALQTIERIDGYGNSELACWIAKIKGDSYRYWATVDSSKIDDCRAAYENAMSLTSGLPADASGLKSSVLNNYACFYAEIEHNHSRAQALADEALAIFPHSASNFGAPIAAEVLRHNKQVWA